jgi:hypothetical protein
VNVIVRNIPESAYTKGWGRPINGFTAHHTAGMTPVMPRRGASWNFMIDRNADLYIDVPWQHAAHCTEKTDKWRPAWVVPGPGVTSDINWCSLSFELVYAPQEGYTPTVPQHETVTFLFARWLPENTPLDVGKLLGVGHGQVDSGKWPTEPHGFSWQRAGFVWTPEGYKFVGAPTEPPPPLPTEPEEEGMELLDEPVLEDAELAHKLMPEVWGEFFDPAAVDHAIPQRWRYEYRRRNQLGKPLGPEKDVPDVPGARYQDFERGQIVYRNGRTSLNG